MKPSSGDTALYVHLSAEMRQGLKNYRKMRCVSNRQMVEAGLWYFFKHMAHFRTPDEEAKMLAAIPKPRFTMDKAPWQKNRDEQKGDKSE